MEVTHECLMRGIAVVRPGVRTGAIGEAIQTFAKRNAAQSFAISAARGGRLFHDSPNILHYGRADEGPELREGMIFTIEPMINLGKPHVKVLSDGWTAVSGSLLVCAVRACCRRYRHRL